MKRALVLSLFVVLVAAFMGSAQELKGSWDSYLKLDLSAPPAIQLASFYSFLDIQYVVGGWTLEAATIIDENGLSDVWFEASGSLGAFSGWSLVVFDPTVPEFVTFENAAEVSIAGVDAYALFAIQQVGGGIGSGFALGGIGTAGAIRIGAEVTWNLNPNLWFIFQYGVNGAVSDWTYTGCASDIWYPYWYIGALSVIQSSCESVFSYLTFIAEFPICCADVYVMGEFSCTGFDYLAFLTKNINIGLDWLKIYELGITYTIDAKDIGFSFQIVSGDVVCFKPYFTVEMDTGGAPMLDGITLNALTLKCDVGGCEFYWGHIFDFMMTRYAGWMWPTTAYGSPYEDDYHFGALGNGLIRSPGACIWRVVDGLDIYYPNEVFGVQCDEDSCCGGLFSFGISNFFSTDLAAPITGIFGWMGSYFQLSAGIGSNISVIGGLNITQFYGVDFVTIGFELAW